MTSRESSGTISRADGSAKSKRVGEANDERGAGIHMKDETPKKKRCTACGHDRELERENAKLRELLQQMLNVAENADETGYVTDCGFVDLGKLHEQVRAALSPAQKSAGA